MKGEFVFNDDENSNKFYSMFADLQKDPTSGYSLFLLHCLEHLRDVCLEMVLECFESNRLAALNSSPEIQEGFRNLIRENLGGILDRMVDLALNEENLNFMMNFVEPSEFLQKKRRLESGREIGFLSHFIMCNPNAGDTVFRVLSSSFKDSFPLSVLKERMKIILEEDDKGMNFIGYSYLTRNHSLHKFLEDIQTSINIDNSDMQFEEMKMRIPKVKEIVVRLRRKDDEESRLEEEVMREVVEQVECVKRMQQDLNMKNGVEGISELMKNWIIEEKESLEVYESTKNKLIEVSKSQKGQYLHIFNHPEVFSWTIVNDVESLEEVMKEIEINNVRLVGVDAEFSKVDQIVNRDQEEWKAELLAEKGVTLVLSSIQICVLNKLYFIDWMQIQDKKRCIGAIRRLFESSGVLKVFHGCQTDLILIFTSMGVIVRNIFDTARVYSILNGLDNSPGLSTLAQKVLNIPLDKAFQKANWKIRPIPDQMLEYSLTDAAILPSLYLELKKQLELDINIALSSWIRVNYLEKSIKSGRPIYEIINEKHLNLE